MAIVRQRVYNGRSHTFLSLKITWRPDVQYAVVQNARALESYSGIVLRELQCTFSENWYVYVG